MTAKRVVPASSYARRAPKQPWSWGSSGEALQQLPADPRPRAVALEAHQVRALVAVQVLDRVVQADLGVAFPATRQGVIEPACPLELLGRHQDQLLIGGRLPVAFQDVSAP